MLSEWMTIQLLYFFLHFLYSFVFWIITLILTYSIRNFLFHSKIFGLGYVIHFLLLKKIGLRVDLPWIYKATQRSWSLKSFWNKYETDFPLSARLLNPWDIIRKTKGPSGKETVNTSLTNKGFFRDFQKNSDSHYKESPWT